MDDEFSQCVAACHACAAACNACAAACLSQPQVDDLRACIALTLDCAQLCAVAAGQLARDSAVAGVTCLACSSVCNSCATECERHDHAHCRRCAAACRSCARQCAQMAS